MVPRNSHLYPNLPLIDFVQDLCITDPTHEPCARVDHHAGYTTPPRQHELHTVVAVDHNRYNIHTWHQESHLP